MLAEHPDVLARLRNEVLETVGPNGTVSPENLKEMKYLRAVLDGKWFTMPGPIHPTESATETLRLYPSLYA